MHLAISASKQEVVEILLEQKSDKDGPQLDVARLARSRMATNA